MRSSDWSSDVCSSDLPARAVRRRRGAAAARGPRGGPVGARCGRTCACGPARIARRQQVGARAIWQYVVGDDPVRARRHDDVRRDGGGGCDRLWPGARRRGDPVPGMNPFASLHVPIAREEEMDAAELLPDRYARVLADLRSEEHTSELQSLMRISYAVFCLKKNNT